MRQDNVLQNKYFSDSLYLYHCMTFLQIPGGRGTLIFSSSERLFHSAIAADLTAPFFQVGCNIAKLALLSRTYWRYLSIKADGGRGGGGGGGSAGGIVLVYASIIKGWSVPTDVLWYCGSAVTTGGSATVVLVCGSATVTANLATSGWTHGALLCGSVLTGGANEVLLCGSVLTGGANEVLLCGSVLTGGANEVLLCGSVLTSGADGVLLCGSESIGGADGVLLCESVSESED